MSLSFRGLAKPRRALIKFSGPDGRPRPPSRGFPLLMRWKGAPLAQLDAGCKPGSAARVVPIRSETRLSRHRRSDGHCRMGERGAQQRPCRAVRGGSRRELETDDDPESCKERLGNLVKHKPVDKGD